MAYPMSSRHTTTKSNTESEIAAKSRIQTIDSTIKHLKKDLQNTWKKQPTGGYHRGKKEQEKANRIMKNIDYLNDERKKLASKIPQSSNKQSGTMSNIIKKVGEFAKSKAGKAIGGLALATVIGYGAYKIYKNYLSKAARSCAGKPDKSACMQQYKNNAIKAQITKLKADSGKCSKSKDPDKCKASIQSKILKLQSKLK